MLDRDAPEGIRQGTIWCWTNAYWVSFVYSAKGDSDSVRRFLGEDHRRRVQCDGTSITTFLERAGGQRPGCWSHGRRRLVEAARGGDKIALAGLKKIGALFAVERQSAIAGETAAERLARRKEHSAPLVEELPSGSKRRRRLLRRAPRSAKRSGTCSVNGHGWCSS